MLVCDWQHNSQAVLITEKDILKYTLLAVLSPICNLLHKQVV